MGTMPTPSQMIRIPRRRVLFYVVSYAVVWTAFFSLIWLLESHDRDLGDELARHGRVAVATVTSSDPGNHNSICFTYEVNGGTYSGCGSADFDKEASQLPPGSQTHVTYDAENPNVYCVCTAASLQGNAYTGTIVGAFWLGTFAWLGVVMVRHTLIRPPSRRVPPLRTAGLPVGSFSPGNRSWKRRGLPWWLWDGGTVRYDLPLTAVAASARIAETIRPEGLFDALVAPGKLRGWVQGTRFRLTTNLPLLTNSFYSVLDGQIEDVSGGSRLIGRFRMRPIVVGFMLVWLTFATAMGLLITITSIADPKSWSPGPPPWFFGIAFPLMGVALVAIGRLFALPQERTILKRLDELFSLPSR